MNIGAALETMQKLIGEYSLYCLKDEELTDDNNSVQEEYMQKLVL